MKHRCPLPFHHIAVRPNNRVFPCCQFRWDQSPEDLHLDHEDVFNHPFMQELRQKMINDEYVEGCTACYRQEEQSNGEHSMRLDFVKEMGNEVPEKPLLTHVDMALSNVCNNRCRMCNPDLSTNWYSDAKKLGDGFFPPVKHSGIKNSKPVLEQYDLSELRYLKLIGGEPLMEEAKFIDLLTRCDLSKLKILLTTNTTLIPSDDLFNLLKQCRRVSVNLSVDAYGPLNDFLRKGSKWDKVLEVMDWFVENFPRSVKIHSVISIYNINNFYELKNFVKERYGDIIAFEYQMVDGPNWIQPCNLPEHTKVTLLKDLKSKVDARVYTMVQDELNRQGNYKLFLDRDSRLNDVRNEDWKTYNPELEKLLA